MEMPLIAICVFLIGQLIAGIWWAATINAKMDFMIDAGRGFAEIPMLYSTKAEVRSALEVADKNTALALSVSDKNIALALKTSDQNIAAMWKQIDALKGIK